MTRVRAATDRRLRAGFTAMYKPAAVALTECFDWWTRQYTQPEERVAFGREAFAVLKAAGYIDGDPPGDQEAANDLLKWSVSGNGEAAAFVAAAWRRWRKDA